MKGRCEFDTDVSLPKDRHFRHSSVLNLSRASLYRLLPRSKNTAIRQNEVYTVSVLGAVRFLLAPVWEIQLFLL